MIYPIGIQDFESLRNDGYVYIDKTEIKADSPMIAHRAVCF